MPRILFIHGEKDPVVPVQQSIDLYNALGEVLPPEKRDDVDVRMRLYKKMGHGDCVTCEFLTVFLTYVPFHCISNPFC
jgi:predicted esterase